jgi:soluble lytic murein transglycosylase
MTPGASVRSAKRRSQRSRKRSTHRRTSRARTRKRTQRRRRVLVIGATLIVGAAAGLLLVNSDRVQRTLQEVTLPLQHEDIIRQQAAEKDVPPDLIAAVIYAESRFRDQTSHAGARGLMQITPETAGVIESLSGGQTFRFEDLADPDLNIRYGAFYLHYLLDKFDGNVVAALAAYNAGETNVAAWGGSDLSLDDIEFPETRGYVEDVMEKRDDYAHTYAHELGLE